MQEVARNTYFNLTGKWLAPPDRVDCVWNVMTHAQKLDFVFRRNGRVHLNRRGSQFSRLLAAEVCASVVVMLDTPCCEVVWRLLATHSIRQFPFTTPPVRRVPSHFNWSLTGTEITLRCSVAEQCTYGCRLRLFKFTTAATVQPSGPHPVVLNSFVSGLCSL